MSGLSIFLRHIFWAKDFLRGSHIRREYCDVSHINLQKDGYEALRACHLQDMLSYAVAQSPMYKECDPASLSSFPVVDKLTLVANRELIIVPPERNPYHEGDSYFIQKTSGSTGTPFAVAQDSRKRARRIAELKFFGEQVGFRSHDKLVQLRVWNKWQSKSLHQSFWENIVPFDISNMSDERVAELCKIINKVGAESLRGYASSFDILAKYVGDNNIKLPSLRVIVAGSETLFDNTRDAVESNIGCDIISQYANEENGILAQERLRGERGSFYLNEASYYFESLKLESDEPAEYGEVGRLVVTDLFNYAHPIIRYDTGDNCVMKIDSESGRPYISQLFGRRLDMIYNTVGEPVFPMLLARTLKNYDSSIRQWQFVQLEAREYVLYITPVTKISSAVEREIERHLRVNLGKDAQIKIEYINQIAVLNSGKRKSVENRWKSSAK